MTLKEIVQERYELEINSLSARAREIVSSHFSDFSRLMVFHELGPHVFSSFTSSENVKQELLDFSNRIYVIYVKEQIGEWKRLVMQNVSSSKDIALESTIDNYLEKAYRLLLKAQGQFVQKTIKINCPHYTQALCFVKREKSVNDFLRSSEIERRELSLFFDNFGEIYKDIIVYYNQKKEIAVENALPTPLKVDAGVPTTKLIQVENRKAKNKIVESHKPQQKKKGKSSKTVRIKKEAANKPVGNDKEIVENDTRSKKQIEILLQDNVFDYSQSPSFYDTPHFSFDDLTMMASINFGCNGKMSFGLSSNYIVPSFIFLYNFERDFVKYNPDEIYSKPIVSDKISRSAHRYKWFGANGKDFLSSLKEYGIVAKCLNLYFGEYICYVPVETDDNDEECLAEVETSDDSIISILTGRKDLVNFLEYEDFSLRDFKLLEITDKLYYICDYYDIYDFLGLNGELYEKNDIVVKLHAEMSQKSVEEILWNSYSLDEKNAFLKQKIKAWHNKDAFLRFTVVKINYLPYSKEIELSYLIHSEYSIEVFVDIDIDFEDGTYLSLSHIKVDSYDDQFVYFQGKTRIKCEKDYLKIYSICLTCSDE